MVDVSWNCGLYSRNILHAGHCVCVCVSQSSADFSFGPGAVSRSQGWIENMYEGESLQNLKVKEKQTLPSVHLQGQQVCPVYGRSGTALKSDKVSI